MKPLPADLESIKDAFTRVPELIRAGVLSGAGALCHEHLGNPFGRFSYDIDLHNAKEDLEAVHHRLPTGRGKPLRLVSKLNEDLFEYALKTGANTLRIELARPYLLPRQKPVPSRHVAGLKVIAFSDLVFAKISALSTRGFPRDLIDLLTVDLEKSPKWEGWLNRAAAAEDNDYSPAELHQRLSRLAKAIGEPEWWEDLPVRRPPSRAVVAEFIEKLKAANQTVFQETLE